MCKVMSSAVAPANAGTLNDPHLTVISPDEAEGRFQLAGTAPFDLSEVDWVRLPAELASPDVVVEGRGLHTGTGAPRLLHCRREPAERRRAGQAHRRP